MKGTAGPSNVGNRGVLALEFADADAEQLFPFGPQDLVVGASWIL